MEEHRLTPMNSKYDPELFNRIYKQVTPLKRKLASTIDSSRFGVDYKEICSWLDIKIIFVFNKHSQEFSENKLQAFIINALKNYRQRILRQSYQQKHSNRPLKITAENEDYFLNLPEQDDSQVEKLESIIVFIESQLSLLEKEVFRADLNPPAYVRSRMLKANRKLNSSIPGLIIAEYLGLGNDKTAINHVNLIRKKIRNVVEIAKIEFKEKGEFAFV